MSIDSTNQTNQTNQTNETLPFLYKESWDKEKTEWKNSPHPTTQDITNTIGGLLTIEKRGVLSYKSIIKTPFSPKKWLSFI
jgi:hypothetical protein